MRIDLNFNEELIVLKDAEGNLLCSSKDCDQIATVTDVSKQNYCRFHYISLWSSIQKRNSIISGNVLKSFVNQSLTALPHKYLEMIRKDLSTEKDFVAALQELGISFSSPDEELKFAYDSDNTPDEY